MLRVTVLMVMPVPVTVTVFLLVTVYLLVLSLFDHRHPRSRGVPAPTRRAHISAHFHREDPQLSAGKHLDISTAAPAQQEHVGRRERHATAFASRAGCNLIDVQAGTFGVSTRSDDVEAEQQRVWNHRAELSDFQPHARYSSLAGTLTHGFDHTLRNRQLVHGETHDS
ncbi:hypothetical protein GCM10020255_074770 [Rhodococcus baikonurensis]